MGASSNLRGKQRRPSWTPASIGNLPIPDPRTWPAAAKARFRELTGDCGPLDVFIFVHGPDASMYLQDAVTAAGVLDVDPSGWQTEYGYPAFHFGSARIQEYSQRLSACGYAVKLIAPNENGPRTSDKPARTHVIDISSGRRRRKLL